MKHADIIQTLDLEQKCALLSGGTVFDTRALPGKNVPSITLSDGPNGVRKQAGAADHLGLNPSVPATCFPPAAGLSSSWNPELIHQVGEAMAEECIQEKVAVILGPGVNIKRNPLGGRCFEYWSEDPYLAGHEAVGIVAGVQSKGVGTSLKHFAANSQETDRLRISANISQRALREIYFPAFEHIVKEAQPWTIMCAYNCINGVHAAQDRWLLTDVLRDEWGFDGMVVSDWGGSNSAVAAVKAGGSLEMPSPGFTSVRELEGAVKAGTLAEVDINKRAAEVAKIAAATKLVGVGRDDLLSDDIAKAHHDIARTVAEHSSVLLKNDAATLPLKPGTRVAVIGDMAATARYQGSGSSKVNATKEENILDEVKNAEGLVLAGYEQGYDRQGKPDKVLLNDAVALAKKDAVDVVLAVVGLDERSESEGLDRSTMAIPQVQNALVEALTKTGKPVVIVLVAGSPVELPWFDDVAAMLYVGLSGQAGASATVRALTGEVNPSGHLAETWPMQYEDCPSSGWYPAIGATMSTCSFKETEAFSVCARAAEDEERVLVVSRSATV